jgi:uncharacterized protein YqeY
MSAPASVDELRAAMRADLLAAMKARDKDAVTALRVALGALDSAEAVPVEEIDSRIGSDHVAGATTGLGSSEAARLELTIERAREVLRAELEDRRSIAAEYTEIGQVDAAEHLRAEADVIERYL